MSSDLTFDGPCLIIANHQSTWATLAFPILFPNVTIVAKQEISTIPDFSWFLRKFQMILIDRESGSKAVRKMIEEGQAAQAQGRSVLILSDKTRKPVPEPIAFKRRVGLLNAPVLPVALNSSNFWGPHRRYKRAGTISISHLDPIAPSLAGHEFAREAERLLKTERRSLWPHRAQIQYRRAASR
jgi:1-acyl-sn-glycerol-3-phosphate acyltransferase